MIKKGHINLLYTKCNSRSRATNYDNPTVLTNKVGIRCSPPTKPPNSGRGALAVARLVSLAEKTREKKVK